MITEDYVSFETAKLLKEKGFDGKCYKVWVHYTSSTPKLWAAPAFVEGETIVDRESVESAERTWNTIYCDSENKNHGYLAPSLQMAMKWLREKYKIFFNVNYFQLNVGNEWLQLTINLPNKNGCEISFEGFDLEEIYEKAVKYCLENLI